MFPRGLRDQFNVALPINYNVDSAGVVHRDDIRNAGNQFQAPWFLFDHTDSSPSAWVLPSEKLKTPLSKDNCWRRHIGPRLDPAGLGWVNFQVMRRIHSSLMKDNNADPKVVADQLGHSLDVNLNVYTQSALSLRKQAVNALESTLAPTSNPRGVSRVM